MSKFLTPPVWYDKNGNLIEMLSGTAMPAGNGPALTNLAIGKSSEAGTPNQNVSMFGTAVGYNAKAYDNSTALGSSANAKSGIAIGFNTNATGGGIGIGGNATGGGIAIGAGASATANQIQLGNNDTAYTLNIGNGRMSLNIGSTAQDNWISATSNGISQGLYLVRYGVGSYIDLVYLMAPITITDTIGGSTYTNDWYFPFYTSPYRLTINNPSNPNNPSHPIVCSCYYLKVDKTSSASNLKITPGYYKNDGDNSTPVFQSMSDGYSVFLFKIL